MSAPPPPPPFPAGFVPPPPPLPPGWTEHRAPAGQPYWFHPATNVSTYVRPLPPPGSYPPPAPPSIAGPPQPLPPLHFDPPPAQKEKKEKKEKPKTKEPIEGTEWIKVVTNKGNVFWTHTETKKSVWVIPDEVKALVEEKERAEREAAGSLKRKEREAEESVSDEPVKEEATVKDEPDEVIIEPKKKKQKKRVVHDIQELQAEDWLKSAAAEQAEESKVGGEGEEADLEGDDSVKEESVDEPKAAKPTSASPPPAPPKTEEPKPVVPDAFIPAPRGQPVDRINVSPEEGAALFKAMLAEKDINPMAPWDMELTKFVNDPRYLAVKQLKDRRDLFDEFCKIKIREQRALKKAAQEAGAPKADPLSAYRSLLLSAVTSTRTHFSDFKRAHAKDPRFREFGRNEGEKEKLFKTWLRELGERKRAEANKAEDRFREMLKEDKAIKPGDKWSEVKLRLVKDPRYDAVNSSSQRESIFTSYTGSLSSTTDGGGARADRAARAAASLKEREEQVRKEKDVLGRNANAARGALGREEGEREFKSLLIDNVRDHEARWEAVASGLESDPRFNSSSLSPQDKRRLFDGHLTEIYNKRVVALEALFLSHAPLLDTPFSTVLPLVIDTPQSTRLVGTDPRRLKGLYDSWTRKRESQSRREFDELLKESPIIDHWGRIQKEAEEKTRMEGGGKKVDVVADEDEEDEDEGALDIGVMAQQIDLKAIHAVLKHDKRYLIFDHEPEQRHQWIKDYLAVLEAPKLTAHQKR